MANFIPTKKTNPCPACDDRKGKCRTFSDSPVVLCMNSAGGLERMGWINTGDTKDGLWGKLIPDDEQTRGKSWQEQQEENARRIERDRAREREKLKYALPEDERSSEFRKLLRQLELNEEDKQELIQRGLTLEEIKELRIKSVQPNQTVEEVKPNLPGISNDTISVADSGYLCPAYDEFGKIVGCQIRLRNAEDNKYRWLKGQFSSHLLVEGDKELPLTVLKGNSQDVYLCEGILKPAIANKRHNRTFIGASGGNFSSSPNQLKRILKEVAKDRIVYFTPDAGFYLNPKVQRRDHATVELIQSLGYEVYILDWGQLEDKTAEDVDEISSEVLEQATAIPASEFLKSPEQKKLEAEYGKEIDPIIGKRDRALNGIQEVLSYAQDTASKFVAWAKGKEQGEGEPTLYAPASNSETVANYRPNRLDEIQGEVIYREGQRQQVWSEANAKGYKIILDRSATGQGKSHTASTLNPSLFDFGGEEEYGQLVMFISEPDNPPVNFSEDWQRLPTLNEDNCHKYQERRALAAKGLGNSGGGKHDKNPICNKCPFLDKCRKGSGDGYGFKFEMKSALATSKLYGHPLGFPRNDNSSAIALYDEFQSLVPATSVQEVTLKQVSRTFTRLQQREWLLDAQGESDSLYEDLTFIKELLEPYLNGEKQTPKFGLDFAELKKHAPDWSEAKTRQIVEIVAELEQDWGQQDKASLSKDSTVDDVDHVIDQPWLSEVLALLTGYYKIGGSLRIYGGKLFITKTNDSAIAQVNSFRTSILLDATLTKEELIFAYGFKPEEILECRQAPTPTPNFTIQQLTGAGLNTSQRSDAGQERKEKILSQLSWKHGGNLGVIDYKDHCEDDSELHHFRSGEQGARGSNRFKEKRAVVSVGTPYIAVNAVLDAYQAITGEVISGDRAREHEGFKQYYDRFTQKEVIQEGGRLRANLRPQENLTFYLVNDFDPSFLSTLGVEVTRQPIWNLISELKPRHLQKWEGLAQFFAQLASRGVELSQAKLKDAAKSVGVKESDLSRLLKPFGGWFELREKINKLFKVSKEAVNFSDWESIFKTKLGELYGVSLLESPETLVSAIEEHGWQAFYEYFKAAQTSVQGELLALLLQIVLRDRANWVEESFQFCIFDLELTEQDVGIYSPPT